MYFGRMELLQQGIVRLSPEHIANILEIYNDVKAWLIGNNITQWSKDYPDMEVLKIDLIKGDYYGLFIKDKLAGVIVINTKIDRRYFDILNWKTNINNESLTVHRLAVCPNFQGKGIATLLMDFAEAKGKENGFKSLVLDTYSQNEINLKFYKKRGYQKVGKIKFEHTNVPFTCFEKIL